MKLRLLFLLLIIIICVSAFAQNNANNTSDSTIYYINSFVYNVDGITRAFALNYRTKFVYGEEITGLSNLERFIQEKTRLLSNERVLESARIEHTIGPAGEDGKRPVDLVIYVKDTWNMIILPYPQYSSNSGFKLTLKARDYNFLGTMSPLRIDVGYHYDENNRTSFTLMLDSDIPFTLWGLNWNLDFDHDFAYRMDREQEFYYKNTTGLSVEFPINGSTLTVGFAESFIVNEENSDIDKLLYGEFQDGLYMSSRVFASWSIPLGLTYYELGELTYTPGASLVFNHEFPQWPLSPSRKGPYLNLSHSIDFGVVDWIDDFRKGASASLYNSFNYNFYNAANSLQPWGAHLSITGTGHKIFNEYLGLSARISYRHWFFDDYHSSAGDNLRGILDNTINANYMLSLNLDLRFRLPVRPSEWFPEISFMNIFDFDLHLVPIIDMALYSDPIEKKVFGLENLLLTAGFEFIVFPKRWRSLLLRVSYGRNFSIGPKGNSSEIYIGTELHY
ncbi:MAG: hypothetical protein FWD28_06815 [Treponema sp.]|nr:hypothetical protein [Treponema sp.]